MLSTFERNAQQLPIILDSRTRTEHYIHCTCGNVLLSVQSTFALRTPHYYGHPTITDTRFYGPHYYGTPHCYVHPAIIDTPLLRTPRYYGHPTITPRY